MNSCYYINMSVCIYPQRAEHVQSCLTANSLRRQRRFSTTWPSYLRAWSDRSAFVETAPRPFNAGAPFINGKRASLVRPGASWTDWWHVTTSAWQWKCGPRAATTWPFCEFVRQQVCFFFWLTRALSGRDNVDVSVSGDSNAQHQTSSAVNYISRQ